MGATTTSHRPVVTVPPASTEAEPSSTLRQAAETLAMAVAPMAVVTGLLYYFGWVRTGALFGQFGVDQRLLGYSAQDYVLRSAGVAFRPAAVVALTAAVVVAGSYSLDRLRARDLDRARSVTQILAVVIGLSILFGVAVVFTDASYRIALVGAWCLLSGALAVGLAGGPASEDRRWTLSRRGVATVAALLGCFWGCAASAQRSGQLAADAWAGDLTRRPGVVLFSTEDLRLSGPGITSQTLAPNGSLRFRYTGLRLLAHGGGRWFLLPEGWKRAEHTSALVLRDEPGLRVELVAPGR
ncbi:hypothetical protein Ais01nite_85040 [Asanoa ishikariensis]|nr:hypothetical protein Ais01nite_85040 [Asanoa ishikariensis]